MQRRLLYHARINARLSLEQIGIRTALSPTVLRNLDEGRYELLPSGVYARSYVRAFATAVGLDPETALAELEPLLPGAPDPLPALNGRSGPDWPAQIVLQLLAALTHRAEGPLQWCRTRSLKAMNRVRELTANDLTAQLVERAALLANRSSASNAASRRETAANLHYWPGLTRCGAATIDALLLIIVDTFLVLLISWSSGIPVEALLRDVGLALGAFCAIPIALYFLLFGGIAGSTLGGYICRLLASVTPEPPDTHDRHHPLTLPDILRRAVRR